MKKIINLLLIVLFFMVVVIPNSFQTFTISIFTLTFVFIFIFYRKVYDVYLIINWLIISFIFLVYILNSPIKINYVFELIFKYIVSPFIWITIFLYIRKNFTLKFIIKNLILLGFICNLSVLFFYTMMSLGYISFLEFFIKSPNIDQISGLGFTLHVYGSLIFFSMSMMPSFFFIRNIFFKILYVLLFVMSALLSGRTALLISVFLGLCFFFVYIKRIKFKFRTILIIVTTTFLLSQIAYPQFTKYFELNLISYIESDHLDKIKASGGIERSMQTDQILNQIYEYPFGSGFITLNIIRSELKTFNYEVLILAILMRFGLITFIIIFISIFNFFSYLFIKKINILKEERDFFILGFFGIIIASFTNPYLESFCFQWMFFGPIILLKEKIIFLAPKI